MLRIYDAKYSKTGWILCIFGPIKHMQNAIFRISEIADEKPQSGSFHDNLVAMYYIENSWCGAVQNTVLAVAVLGGL